MPRTANPEAGSGGRAGRNASKYSSVGEAHGSGGEAGGVRSRLGVRVRWAGGKVAGFGGVWRGTLGVLRACGVALLPHEGTLRSGVNGEL